MISRVQSFEMRLRHNEFQHVHNDIPRYTGAYIKAQSKAIHAHAYQFNKLDINFPYNYESYFAWGIVYIYIVMTAHLNVHLINIYIYMHLYFNKIGTTSLHNLQNVSVLNKS